MCRPGSLCPRRRLAAFFVAPCHAILVLDSRLVGFAPRCSSCHAWSPVARSFAVLVSRARIGVCRRAHAFRPSRSSCCYTCLATVSCGPYLHSHPSANSGFRIDAHLFDFCCNARPDHPRIFALARFQRPVHISGSSAASNSSTSQALQIAQNTPLARHRTFYSPAPPTVSNTVLLPNFFPQPIAGYFLSLCPQPDLMCMYLRRSRFITSFCLEFVCAVCHESQARQ